MGFQETSGAGIVILAGRNRMGPLYFFRLPIKSLPLLHKKIKSRMVGSSI